MFSMVIMDERPVYSDVKLYVHSVMDIVETSGGYDDEAETREPTGTL